MSVFVTMTVHIAAKIVIIVGIDVRFFGFDTPTINFSRALILSIINRATNGFCEVFVLHSVPEVRLRTERIITCFIVSPAGGLS